MDLGGGEGATSDERALTIHLKGIQFDGGRLPVSKIATLSKMNTVVAAIARDLDLANREDGSRSSRHAKVELVLVGEIGEGSALLKLLIVPVLLASSTASQASQTALLEALPEAVPAIVQAIHENQDVSYPVSEKTKKLVAEVGQNLDAKEELVLGPSLPHSIQESVTATVTRSSSIRAQQSQEVSKTRPFFVTGTLRQLENHGDDPGKLTLATTTGLYTVPSVEANLLERAAGLLSGDRNIVLALSGTGVFDGAGRLKSLSHLSDMTSIDRHFNPDRRLTELADVAETSFTDQYVSGVRSAVVRAAIDTGLAPGLFLDEDEKLEARWLIRRSPGSPAQVVNITFGATLSGYVFDRATSEIKDDFEVGTGDVVPGEHIASIIRSTVEHVNG